MKKNNTDPATDPLKLLSVQHYKNGLFERRKNHHKRLRIIRKLSEDVDNAFPMYYNEADDNIRLILAALQKYRDAEKNNDGGYPIILYETILTNIMALIAVTSEREHVVNMVVENIKNNHCDRMVKAMAETIQTPGAMDYLKDVLDQTDPDYDSTTFYKRLAETDLEYYLAYRKPKSKKQHSDCFKSYDECESAWDANPCKEFLKNLQPLDNNTFRRLG